VKSATLEAADIMFDQLVSIHAPVKSGTLILHWRVVAVCEFQSTRR